MLKWSKRYQELGFDVIPVIQKQPYPGFTSRGPFLTSRVPAGSTGLALRIGRLWVLDVDKRNGGLETLAALPELPATWHATTGGGGHHFWFSAEAADRPSKPFQGVDLLHGDRYVLVAPSPGYTWVVPPTAPIAELPRWVPERAPLPALDDTPSGADMYDRAAAYIQAYPPAVSGQGGHNRTFVLAMRLARYFMLGDRDAMQLLERWNKDCRPPWSEKELRHKLDSARRNGTMRRV